MKRIHFAAAALLVIGVTGAHAAESPVNATAGSFFQVVLGMAVVLALMAAAAWALKRFGAVRPAGAANIRIVGGVSVGGRERVLVIEAADQWIVVGVAPGRVNALATLPRQESAELPTETPGAKNFSAWLRQTMEKRNVR